MSAAPSPDGRTIAFTSLSPQEDVYVVPSGGGTPVQLTDDPEFDRYVSWSPDGKRPLFESLRNGRYETWAIHPDGSGLEPLTRTTREESGWVPLLSPAGDRLATSLADGIAVFDARQALPWEHPQRFPPPPGPPGTNFGALAWSPDGRRLAGYVYRGNDPPRAAVLDLGTKEYRLFDPPSRTAAGIPTASDSWSSGKTAWPRSISPRGKPRPCPPAPSWAPRHGQAPTCASSSVSTRTARPTSGSPRSCRRDRLSRGGSGKEIPS